MNRARLTIALLLTLVFAPERGSAASELPGFASLGEEGGEVTVDAATITYDQQRNVITATGAVQVKRGTMTLTADTVRVNRTTQVAEAEGHVVLTDPEGTLNADALSLNLVAETGAVENGSVYLEKNRYQLSGRHFEKLVGQSYRVDGGRFTTCLCGEGRAPSWSIRGERVTLDLEGYGRVEQGAFEVRGVPIMYLPYGLFPLKRERQTGFLFPRFGFSNRRGFQVEQPFFIDINKSMDATISLDIETEARIGALAEFRYALSTATLGELHGSYFNEQIRGASSDEVVNERIADPNIPIDRWSAGLTHDQWLPLGMRGFADVFRVSDDLFLREINVFTFNPGVDVALRTRRYERSRVGVERQFERGIVTATGTWFQDFINPDRFVFQTPPRIEGHGSWRMWDDRVAVNVAGEGANFERDQGFAGQRADIQPELELPWRLRNYAFGSWRAGLRGTAYTLNDTTVPEQVNVNPADPGSKPPSILPALDEDALRGLFYVRGEARTVLGRVYPYQRFGIAALKHTIEPSLDYLFVPRTNTRQAALPLFDDVDRVNRRSVFTYGATSRVLARMASADASKPGPIRELGRFSIFQSYDVNNKGGDFIDEVDEETGQVERGPGDRASDLGLYLRLTPAEFLSVEGRTDYSVVHGKAKGASVHFALADPFPPKDDFTLASLRGRSRVSFGYRFVANSAVEEVNWGALLRITKQYYAAYETRYDNLSKRFLENRYGIRMISDCECWVLDVGISDRVNPNETEVRVLLTLVGLGQFGKEPFRRSLGQPSMPSGNFLGIE